MNNFTPITAAMYTVLLKYCVLFAISSRNPSATGMNSQACWHGTRTVLPIVCGYTVAAT